jgi:hypothetical protein
MFKKEEWRNYLFFTYRGIRVMVSGVIWPLFIFVIIPDYLSIGALETVIAGVSALLVWIMGKYSDHIPNRRSIIRFVAIFESLGWFIRTIIASAAQVLGVTMFGAVTYGSLESPIGALEYDKAKKDITAYFVTREIFISLGRIILLLVVLATNSLTSGMILNGIAGLAAFLF